MRPATKTAHEGRVAGRTTTVPADAAATLALRERGLAKDHEYPWTDVPTRLVLEKRVAFLEDGDYGLAFASGAAALAAVMSVLEPGDEIIVAEDGYGGARWRVGRTLEHCGVRTTYADDTSTLALEDTFTAATRLVWIETPSSPLLCIADIAGVAEVCRKRGAFLVIDNTCATPSFQQPLSMGADVVVHSTLKYLSGHPDVEGGIVVTNSPEIYERAKSYQDVTDAALDTLAAWLALRDAGTLALRMKQHEANALAVSRFLAGRSEVGLLLYPGRVTHPQYDVAQRQMTGFGATVTFEIAGGRAAAERFVEALRAFLCAGSLTEVESLVRHPGITPRTAPSARERERMGAVEGMIRLSVGIEDTSRIIEDVTRALAESQNHTRPQSGR